MIERIADAEPFEREFKGLTEFAAVSLGESIQLALLHVGRNEALGFFYYVMELADDAERGRSIDPERYVPLTFTELRKRRGRIAAGDCLTYGTELARVFAGLHARGLVHRDIKPSNVIFVNGVPKLADIGLVSPAASARTFVGTDGIVPPEGPGSTGTDVYALGKVLYELSTGLDRQDFPQLPSGLTGLGDHDALLDLNEIILRACDPSPAQRYRDGAALLADLQRLRAGRPVLAQARWPYALAAVAAAVLGAVGFFAVQKKTATPSPAIATHPTPAAPPTSLAPAPAPQARHVEPAARSLVPADNNASFVVLPLENRSPDPADANFAEGLHEELIASLVRWPDVKVIGRTTALRFRNSRLPWPQFTEWIGVAHVLGGSVRREGDQVRIELEFYRVRDEGRVWTKRYDTALPELFAVQTHVAQELTRVLRARAPDPNFANSKFFTHDAAAFDALLKARRTRDGAAELSRIEAAIAFGEEAVKRDPNYGAAALLLSTSYVTAYRAERDQATRPRFTSPAKRWAETAARLIPGGGADRALAHYYLSVEPDTSRGVPLAQTALRAAPNDAEGALHVRDHVLSRRTSGGGGGRTSSRGHPRSTQSRQTPTRAARARPPATRGGVGALIE